jgi:RNA polymerase sigma factor (sigma-70 family)
MACTLNGECRPQFLLLPNTFTFHYYPQMARLSDKTAMDSYLNEIARHPLMTPEEEIEQGRIIRSAAELKDLKRPLTTEELRLQKRAERAKKRFVEANLRLVVYIAKKYASRNPVVIDMLDLVQEGAVGLMRAAEMFDPERGYKFSTYSYWWCRQAMTRSLQVQERLIRRPHTVIEMASKLPKAVHEETLRLGRPPSTAELAKKLTVKESEILLLMERGGPVISLDSQPLGTEQKSFADIVADPNSMDSEDQDLMLELEMRMPQILFYMETLTEIEKRYVQMRFGLGDYLPHTYQQIAKTAGVSRERIRQILDKALRKLRLQLSSPKDAPPLVETPSPVPLPAGPKKPLALVVDGPWAGYRQCRERSKAQALQCAS